MQASKKKELWHSNITALQHVLEKQRQKQTKLQTGDQAWPPFLTPPCPSHPSSNHKVRHKRKIQNPEEGWRTKVPMFHTCSVLGFTIQGFQGWRASRLKVPQVAQLQTCRVPRFQDCTCRIIGLEVPGFQIFMLNPEPSHSGTARILHLHSSTFARFSGSTVVPGFQGSGFHSGSSVPRFQVPRFQGSRVPGFQGSRVPEFQGSRVPKFQGSRVSFRFLVWDKKRCTRPSPRDWNPTSSLLGTTP